ncbi:MAG: zinc ABC transporter substrate-binding protein [Acetobacteraceae bacterium]
MLSRRTLLAAIGTATAMPVLPVRAAERLRVVASFSILADLVGQIGGGRVEVTTLIPPGVEAHGFDPRVQDMKAVATADVFVVNGLGFEPWAERVAKAAAFRGRGVVATRGVKALPMVERRVPGVKLAHSHAHGHDHGSFDPHAWQDVANTKRYAANIAEALAAADAANAAYYSDTAARYAATLDRLDTWIREQFRLIPRDRRRLLTSHESFNYYADTYDLDIFGAQGVSAESEPSARAIADLIAQIKAGNIRAAFLESAMSPRLVTEISRETGVRIGGTLYADSLSAPGGPAATYEAMMRTNTTTIAAALR